MNSSNHPDRPRDEAPESRGPADPDAGSLDGSGFTEQMHDGEGEADDRMGAQTAPSGDGGSGSR